MWESQKLPPDWEEIRSLRSKGEVLAMARNKAIDKLTEEAKLVCAVPHSTSHQVSRGKLLADDDTGCCLSKDDQTLSLDCGSEDDAGEESEAQEPVSNKVNDGRKRRMARVIEEDDEEEPEEDGADVQSGPCKVLTRAPPKRVAGPMHRNPKPPGFLAGTGSGRITAKGQAVLAELPNGSGSQKATKRPAKKKG